MATTTNLKYVDPSREPGVFPRFYAAVATTRLAKLVSRLVSWKLDPLLLRATRGRFATTLVFPTAVLETIGAKSGAPRDRSVHCGRISPVAREGGKCSSRRADSMSERSHQGQIAGTRWDPGQYLKFSDHRLRPALELLARVPLASPRVIYDVGCGAGEVTRLIAERWPSATVYGVDNSPEMLAKAAAEPRKIHWIEADLHDWQPDEPPTLLYSNATLHWVDAHRALFPRLVASLAPGGCLAVQMPLSWDAPSHRLMRETLANGGPDGRAIGSAELGRAVARNWVEDAAVYYDLLAGSTQSLDIWETEYLQILEGEDPVLEWVKGTGLRPILNGLDDAERELFLAEYKRRLRLAYPARADGRTVYPFRRLFIVATV